MKKNIVFITDNNYIKPTVVAISSLLNNCNKNRTYIINILGNNLNNESTKLLNSISFENAEINIMDATFYLKDFKTIKENRHVTKSAILKFFLPNIFKNLDTILYLDGDLIIQKDLKELFDTDIKNYYAAVVKDTFSIRNKKYMTDFEIFNENYFNSGVLYLNLKKMREDNIVDKLIEYKNKHNTFFMDQDAFNSVIGHNVEYLSYKYNFLNYYLENYSTETLSNIFEEDIKGSEEEIYKTCHILHFGGKEKPWVYNLKNLTNIFFEEKNKSIFKDEIWTLKKTYNEIVRNNLIESMNKFNNKKLALWGASNFIEDFFNTTNFDNLNIIGIIDKNQNRWEEKIGQYKIFPPTKISELGVETILLTVKNHHEEIYNELQLFLQKNHPNIKLLADPFCEN